MCLVAWRRASARPAAVRYLALTNVLVRLHLPQSTSSHLRRQLSMALPTYVAGHIHLVFPVNFAIAIRSAFFSVALTYVRTPDGSWLFLGHILLLLLLLLM